jgi:endonuclease G, mitochondrial
MDMTFKHLEDGQLNEVTQALIKLGLTKDSDFEALTANISPEFAGALTQGQGNVRLIIANGLLNTTRVLMSGEVPIVPWLKSAILLSAGRTEELIFRKALERVSADGRAAVDDPIDDTTSAADVDAAAAAGALEVIIGEDDTIEVSFLTGGVVAAQSVAKLLVHRHFEGTPSFLAGNEPDLGKGTGWLIAPKLLITNHHVVNARVSTEPDASQQDFDLQGAHTHVRFDYLADDSPAVLSQSVSCLASNKTLDYALLRLPHDAPTKNALRLRTQAVTKSKERKLRERVNVLQHPDGAPMRLGFRNNFVITGSQTRLSYLTDTAGGASGSPICDDKWHVAALHRGWQTMEEPVPVWGLDIHQENYGTPLVAILEDLKIAHPDLLTEIEEAQAALI